MTIKELRDKRAKLIVDARAFIEQRTKEGKALSAEDLATVTAMRNEAKGIGDTIEAQEALETDERALVPDTQRFEQTTKQADKAAQYGVREYVLDVAQGRRPEVREMNLTGGSGGYTVAPDTRFYGIITEAQKAFGAMLAAATGCTVLTTSTGADLPFPTDDDTSNSGTIIDEEGSHASGTAVTLSQKVLKAYMFSSKVVKISLQLLQDSAVDFESYLARKLGTRVGRAKNSYFTTGTGSSQPQGAQYASYLGRTGASGQTTTITADDFIRLYHSVDPAYRMNGKFMLNDTTLLAAALLKDGNGRYLLSGVDSGEPTRIYGKPFIVNQDMPDMAASVKSVLFGDFSYYHIRNVRGLSVVVLRELYAANGQVGVVALERADGGLIDAGTHPIKNYTNAAS